MKAGFTLVEMLVALAALAVLAAGALAVASASTTSHDVIRERQAHTQDLMRLRAALKADTSQAAPRRPRDVNGAKEQAALSGGSGNAILSVVRRGWDNPLEQSRASLQYVEYRLNQDRIERYWRRHVDGAPLASPQVLLEGVSTVSMSFLDRDQWLQAWAGAPNRPLPRAIRLDIRFTSGDTLSQVLLLPEVSL